MPATILGPYNFISGTGITVAVAHNAATGMFDVTVTNTGSLPTPVPVSDGGTGQVSGTAHTVALWEGTAAIGSTNAGSFGAPLLSAGGSSDPAFGRLDLSSNNAVQGAAANEVLAGTSFNTVGAISNGTAGWVLTSNGAGVTPTFQAPTWIAGPTTAHAVAIGTGSDTLNWASTNTTAGIPLVQAGGTADPVFSTCEPIGGGTGLTNPTAHAVLIGQGTSPMTVATIGTAGRYLRDNGAGVDPSFQGVQLPVAPQSSSASVSLTGTTPAVMGTVAITTPNDGITRSVVLVGNVNITNTNPTTSWTATFGFSVNSTSSYSVFDSAFLSSGGSNGTLTAGINTTLTQAPNTTTTYRWMANLNSGASGVSSNGYLTAMVF